MRILFLILLLISCSVSAQDLVITVQQTTSTEDPEMQEYIDRLGNSESVTYIKGPWSRVESKGETTGGSVNIFNKDTQEGLMLVQNPYLGNKYLQYNTSEFGDEQVKDDETAPKPVKTGNTREIFGYKCDEYILDDGHNSIMTVYVTEEIPNPKNGQHSDDLTGFPLYSSLSSNIMGVSMTITMETTNIEKGNLKMDLFDMTIPEGFTEMEGPE